MVEDCTFQFIFRQPLHDGGSLLVQSATVEILRDRVHAASVDCLIGTGKLREITNDKNCNFVLWVGNKRLIKKTLVDGDARKMSLFPTSQGLELEDMLKQTALETQQIIMEGMAKSEQEEFNRLLEIALAHMSAIRTKRV